MALNLKATLALDGSGFAAGARLVSSQLASLKGLIASTFTVGAISGLAKSTLSYAGQLNDLSKRLGVSTDFLQEFRFIAQQTGTDLEALTKIIEKVREARETAMTPAGEKERAIFAALGISPDMLAGTRLEDLIFGPIAKALNGADVQGKIGAAWKEIGGKSAGALISAFEELTPEMREQIRAKMGFMTEPIIKELDAVGDQLDILGDQLKGLFGKLVVFGKGLLTGGISLNPKNWMFLPGGIPIPLRPGAVPGVSELFSGEKLGPKYGPPSPDFWANHSPAFLMDETRFKHQNQRSDIATDSLISVGNFLGKGPQIISQITETNNILKTHTVLLTRIANYKPPNSDFPGT